MRKQTFTERPDERMAQLAERDHGVLAVAELLTCGLTHAGIHRRVKMVRLHRLHRGVYAVGHVALTREGYWLAAVKACGPGAALSHRSAAELWELAPRWPGPAQVTVPYARKPGADARIELHRSRTLEACDITQRARIPVTTPARTLRDLKRILPREEWETAVDRARGRGCSVADVVDEAPTRSALERKFLRLCRRHRIPAPRVNTWVHGFLVDFLWAESALVVEVDGYEFHRGRDSFESDRARDAELAAQGYRVLRFTYRQVTEGAGHVAGTIRRLLRL